MCGPMFGTMFWEDVGKMLESVCEDAGKMLGIFREHVWQVGHMWEICSHEQYLTWELHMF